MSAHLSAWPVQNAKARFSELLDVCLAEGPQTITRRGQPAAVLVPVAQWQRLSAATRPTLKELLLTDEGRFEFDVPPRGQAKRRAPQAG